MIAKCPQPELWQLFGGEGGVKTYSCTFSKYLLVNIPLIIVIYSFAALVLPYLAVMERIFLMGEKNLIQWQVCKPTIFYPIWLCVWLFRVTCNADLLYLSQGLYVNIPGFPVDELQVYVTFLLDLTGVTLPLHFMLIVPVLQC